jgi:hypothetical protein
MMSESAGQPVKDPQEFARTYAGVVQQIIEEHKKQRIPDSFQQADAGAQRMDLTAPGRRPDYIG